MAVGFFSYFWDKDIWTGIQADVRTEVGILMYPILSVVG